jgi:hypothetical protein
MFFEPHSSLSSSNSKRSASGPAPALEDCIFELSLSRGQLNRRQQILETLEASTTEAAAQLRNIKGITMLPGAPENFRCISYLFNHLLNHDWALNFDQRLDPPPYYKEPVIVNTITTLRRLGYEVIDNPRRESVEAGSIVIYGEYFAHGYKIVSSRLSQGQRISFLRAAESKPPAFLAEHFGLIVQNSQKGNILVESKLGQGPACIHELEIAPYGKHLLFFSPVR